MSKRTQIGALGIWAIASLSVLRYRRRWLGWLLKLPPIRFKVHKDYGLYISMPDGVKLATSHYTPKGEGSFPTILIRTPYGRKGFISSSPGLSFAERGFHVIIQDVRGRFDSGGEFDPIVNEASDGQATLEWIRQQPWFNGSVGTWGASYLGFVQWAIAVDNPPELKAIMPCITASEFYNVTRKVFGLEGTLFWLEVLKANGGRSFLQETFSQIRTFGSAEKLRKKAAQILPVRDADEVVMGKPVPFYRNWLEHSSAEDPYWKARDFGDKVAKVQASTHFVSGWYDFMLRELLMDYAKLLEAGKQPYLTIGPWGHLSLVGGVEQTRQGIYWFNAQLKGDRSHLRQKAVRFYVTGAKQWREIESWPPSSHTEAYFLQGQQQLAPTRPGSNWPPDHYRYNPADPTPNVGGSIFSQSAGPQDNRAIEARPDVLKYTSEVLSKDMEVIGTVRLELYVKSSLAHTDFFGRLCEVWPDGRSMNVCDGIIRVEPGIGELQPDGSLCLSLDIMAIAHQFKAGNKLRLQVSSGAFPRFSRNLGTGEPLISAVNMLPADQMVFHDTEHPSALFLPVV